MGQLLLVRHGQASYGAADYDVLSDVGHRQAAVLGAFLAGRGLVADRVVHGSMRRQGDTAAGLVAGAGWSSDLETDPRWNEMDHDNVLARSPQLPDFQAWFEAATDRWQSGGFDIEYDEPFSGFTGRVDEAVADAASRDGLTVVVSSGGPISHVVATLVGGGLPAYRRLAPVVVNASTSLVVSGQHGLTLVSFNEHGHLPPDLVTYR